MSARHITAPKRPALAKDPAALAVRARNKDDVPAAVARALESPAAQASQTLYALNAGAEMLEAERLRDELTAQIDAMHGGDLKRAEGMLLAQAHTLDGLFNHYVRSAKASELLHQFEIKLRLALKAQSQCRATLETLAAIKNPQPVAFVRQANIAHGPQQVNNGNPPEQASRARKTQTAPDGLLRLTHEETERLDFGAASAAGAPHSAVAAVGALDGTKDGRG